MSSLAKWRLSPGAVLTWRSWGDEYVVFNAQTGDTHLLDTVGREGLLCFEEACLDQAEICRRLATRLEIEPDEQLGDYVGKLLARFSQLGLVESVAS
jgi:PqqD family protein of HPr-rel-A system